MVLFLNPDVRNLESNLNLKHGISSVISTIGMLGIAGITVYALNI